MQNPCTRGFWSAIKIFLYPTNFEAQAMYDISIHRKYLKKLSDLSKILVEEFCPCPTHFSRRVSTDILREGEETIVCSTGFKGKPQVMHIMVTVALYSLEF